MTRDDYKVLNLLDRGIGFFPLLNGGFLFFTYCGNWSSTAKHVQVESVEVTRQQAEVFIPCLPR